MTAPSGEDPFAGLVLRPVIAGDAVELTRIRRTERVRRWSGEPEEDFPWDEPESTRWTIELDGAVAGPIQFHEERLRTGPRFVPTRRPDSAPLG